MLFRSIGILVANAMLGEITPTIAESVGTSEAPKVLVPTAYCNVMIAGTKELPVRECIEDAVDRIVRMYSRGNN